MTRDEYRAACDAPPGQIRAAYTSVVPGGSIDQDVAAAFADALEVLAALGLELVQDAPDLTAVPELFAPIVEVAFAGIGTDLTDDQLARIGPKCMQLMKRGWRISASDYYATLQAAHRETARIQRFWETYDVLVTPTVPWVPPRRDALPETEEYVAKWAQYGVWETFTSPWNLTGQPAISVPCRRTGEGHIPIGLQLVGRPSGEAELFTLAASYEAAAPWDYRHALGAGRDDAGGRLSCQAPHPRLTVAASSLRRRPTAVGARLTQPVDDRHARAAAPPATAPSSMYSSALWAWAMSPGPQIDRRARRDGRGRAPPLCRSRRRCARRPRRTAGRPAARPVPAAGRRCSRCSSITDSSAVTRISS